MKNLLILIGAIAIIFFAFKMQNSSTAPKTNPATKQTASTLNTTGLSGINYSQSVLTDDMVTYLKNKSEYKDYLDKKLVIYPAGASCPYAHAFERAVKKIRQNPSYEEEYNFYALDASGSGMMTFSTMEEAQAHVNFSNTCHEFCIINPKNNEIFAIDGVGYEEAERLGEIFTQLENW